MATHSSVFAWRIPGTGEPGGLPSTSHTFIHLNPTCLCSDIETFFFFFLFPYLRQNISSTVFEFGVCFSLFPLHFRPHGLGG